MKLLKALSFLCYKKFSEQTKNTQKGDLVCFFYRISTFKNHKYTSFLFLLDYIANIRYIH